MDKDFNSLFDKYFSKESLEHYSTRECYNILSNELAGLLKITTYRINPRILYRGRLNYDQKKNHRIDCFTSVSELWAPKNKHGIAQGRCNTKNQSLLYCCNDFSTIFFEIPIKEGDELTLIAFEIKSEIPNLCAIGVNKLSEAGNDYKRILTNYFKNFSETNIIVHKKLSEIFAAPHNDALIYYNLTNAISKILLHKANKSIKTVYKSGADSIGFLYPSVAVKRASINFVFKPTSVKNYFKPIEAYKIRIHKIYDSHNIDVSMTHKTKKIRNDNILNWEPIKESEINHITDF